MDETIQIWGHDCFYMPRESWDEIDKLYGEDVTSKFTKTFTMEMYINTGNQPGTQFDGEQDFFSKFGLEVRDSMNFLVSMRTFQKYIPSNIRNTPKEGDLIFVPFLNKIFEIKFVETNAMFYTLGKKDAYMAELRTELFRYSNETVDTGIDVIDDLIRENQNTTRLTLEPNTGTGGDYHLGEMVYADANTSAEVRLWDPEEKTLDVTEVHGVFQANTLVVGAQSGASYLIKVEDSLGDYSTHELHDNYDLEILADSILDRSETNRFGKS